MSSQLGVPLPLMLPGLEEALIGAGALVVTAGGTIGAAWLAFRATLRSTRTSVASASADILKQIEAASSDMRDQLAADREQRVWEKRAEVYTDAVALNRHEMKVRGIQFVATVIGSEQERPKPPVDPVSLEARLVVFCSPAVLAAQKAYVAAAQRFEDEYRIWQEDTTLAQQAQEQVGSGVIPPTLRNSREDLERARAEADKLSDEVIALIRSELHDG